jgi:hypothetical protein
MGLLIVKEILMRTVLAMMLTSIDFSGCVKSLGVEKWHSRKLVKTAVSACQPHWRFTFIPG